MKETINSNKHSKCNNNKKEISIAQTVQCNSILCREISCPSEELEFTLQEKV